MTHAWVKLTHGRTGELDGGDENFKMLANLLCEICGFTFPFMEQFTQEGQLKNWQQPEYLTSAVGDILQWAVGDIQFTSAVGDGDLPSSSSNQPSSDQAPAAENMPQPRLDLDDVLPPPLATVLPQSVPPPLAPPEVFTEILVLEVTPPLPDVPRDSLGREIPVYTAGPVHRRADGAFEWTERGRKFEAIDDTADHGTRARYTLQSTVQSTAMASFAPQDQSRVTSKKKFSRHARRRSSADMATREEEERHAANSGADDGTAEPGARVDDYDEDLLLYLSHEEALWVAGYEDDGSNASEEFLDRRRGAYADRARLNQQHATETCSGEPPATSDTD